MNIILNVIFYFHNFYALKKNIKATEISQLSVLVLQHIFFSNLFIGTISTTFQTFPVILCGVCGSECAAYNSPAILFRMSVCVFVYACVFLASVGEVCLCSFQREYSTRSLQCEAARPVAANVNSQAHNFP